MVIIGQGFCRQNSRSASSKNGWSQKEPKYWVIRRYGSGGFRQYMWAIICGSRGLQSAMVSETLDRGRISRIVSIWVASGGGTLI